MTKQEQSLPWTDKADAAGFPPPDQVEAKIETTEETPAEAPSEPEEASGSRRSVMSLGDRIDVIDAIRSRPEPFVGRTKVEIAKRVAEAAGVPELTADSLWYLVRQVPKLKLDEKLVLLEEESPEAKLATLAAEVAELKAGRDNIATATHMLITRVSDCENRLTEFSHRLDALALRFEEAVEAGKARSERLEDIASRVVNLEASRAT